MNVVSRRHLLFARLIPGSRGTRNADYLPQNTSFEKEINTESFRFKIRVSRTNDTVLKMERVEWYDPISRQDMSKNMSELYILDSDEM